MTSNQDSTQGTFVLNDLPFWHSVVGCGQDACFGVTDSSSGKLKKEIYQTSMNT